MIVFPPCKINLGLKITAKRSDGYHDLETIFYPIPVCDALEVIESKETTTQKARLEISGLPIDGSDLNNLVLKAYHLLDKDFSLPPVQFCLHKIIPMCAGLGGGSSDGAYALRLLNSYFGLNLNAKQLQEYAATLGSDCAFFVQDHPCIGRGRGEILEPIGLSLAGYWLALVKPPIHISTAEAFAKVVPKHFEDGDSLEKQIQLPIQDWKSILSNDFEDSVFPAHPHLAQIKEMLYAQGATYAAMSGSGSSLFGLFTFEPNLKGKFVGNDYREVRLS